MSDLLDRTLGERIRIEVDLARDTWPIYVDPHQLENAIVNLAVNARDAMDGQGMMRIATENVKLAANEVGDIRAGDYVKISVTDTGCGMTARSARARVRALLHHQAGRQGHRPRPQPDLRLRPSVGRRGRDRKPGRQGHDRLDLSAAHRSRSAASGSTRRCSAPTRDVHVPGARILLVEDDPRVRAATVDALEDLDYEPVAVRSGAEAIELFNAQEFDLVITDVIMPEMTGPELIRHLKATEPRDFAVLFVTGYVGEGESDDLRGHELLRKPFTVGALAGAVAAALARTASEPPRTAAAAARG